MNLKGYVACLSVHLEPESEVETLRVAELISKSKSVQNNEME
jgi:hypothetical protein